MVINNITSNTGLNVSDLMQTCFDSINKAGETLSTEMKTLLSSGTEISQAQMLQLQFEIGQYNAMMEVVSTVSKSLTDMMKTLAQRSS
jgi:type III secretion protein F